MKPAILLIAETIDNRVVKTSHELTGLARGLNPDAPPDAMFVASGDNISSAAEALAGETGLPVTAFEGPAFACPNPELLADLVCDMVRRNDIQIVCFSHTTCGCHGAARTATRLNAPCVSAVEGLEQKDGALVLYRSICNGRLKMSVTHQPGPLVLTLLPGAFKPAEPPAATGAPPFVAVRKVVAENAGFHPVGMAKESSGDTALEHADIIVAVGRGIGDPENIEIVNRLARILPNAAVAASRPLCDLKWLPYSRQVGATGRTVSPKLYIACGISGAQQHVQGMKDSQWIVAINTDPRAAIFSVAHFGVVENILTFLPLLTDAYREMKKA